MKKKIIIYGFIGISNLFYSFPTDCFVVDNYNGRTPVKSIPKPLSLGNTLRAEKPIFSGVRIETNPLHLRKIIEDMLLYFEKVRGAQRHYTQPVEFSTRYMSLEKVKETLRFIKKTIDEDEFFERSYRILDSKFIENNFAFFGWTKPIRVTRYTVYRFEGSTRKTKKYNCALYGLLQHHTIPTCTKQEIMNGVFETDEYKNLVKPLVWVTRDDLERALMEGHALITMPNRKICAFSTYIDNGIPYQKGNIKPKDQKRYWFFKEKPYAETLKFYNQCIRRKDVMFAGEIGSFGLG